MTEALRQLEILSKLKHPNLVPIRAFAQTDTDRVSLVSELDPCVDLQTVIQQQEGAPFDERLVRSELIRVDS